MAGNEEVPPPALSAQQPSGSVKTLSCTHCGAAISVKYPGSTMTVVCNSCHSVIDVTDENYRILYQFSKSTQVCKPRIQLGTRGKLKGEQWEVTGYIVRQDRASCVTWDEYLLFNPYHGYRWLTENNGHWNFVKTIKENPAIDCAWSSRRHAELDGKKYKLFYDGTAIMLFVLGEFYWRIEAEQKVEMEDYICPPEMLSSERDDKEVVWSLSEYIASNEVAEAFKLRTDELPQQQGIAANQLSPWSARWEKISRLWIVFFALLTAIEIGFCVTAANKSVFKEGYPYIPNSKSTQTLTTSVFNLEKSSANLSVKFDVPDVSNSWFYSSGELVNNKTGEVYPFERTVEYYFGVDGGESWSEGSTVNQILFSSVPGGDYYLNLDFESGSFKDLASRTFFVMVRRDVPDYANYFWCLFFVSIIPVFTWIRSRSYEVQRWSDSDYSPYASSGD